MKLIFALIFSSLLASPKYETRKNAEDALDYINKQVDLRTALCYSIIQTTDIQVEVSLSRIIEAYYDLEIDYEKVDVDKFDFEQEQVKEFFDDIIQKASENAYNTGFDLQTIKDLARNADYYRKDIFGRLFQHLVCLGVSRQTIEEIFK